MVRLGDVNPVIWDVITEKMEEELKEFKFKADDIAFDWRVNAASKKFEREIFQKYGLWKDIILHPRFQQVKTIAEENIDFDFQLGDPFIPSSTSVIILFMMHKRVKNSILFLIAGLLFNINPFYVFLSYILWFYYSANTRPKKFVAINSKTLNQLVSNIGTCEPKLFNIDSFKKDFEENVDHVLIGNDISTLYCAALLSKVGHRCCVLQPIETLPLEVHPEGTPCPVPLQNCSIGKAEKYQSLLDVVTIKDKSSNKALYRSTFAPVGTNNNAYMNYVIKTTNYSQNEKSSNNSKDKLWILHPFQF